MQNPKIKFVTFDVDGTLIDSQNMIIRCLQMACEEMKIPTPESRTQLLAGVGLPLAEAIPVAIPHIRADQIGEFIKHFRVHYDVLRNQVAELQPMYPGALDMLRQLKAHGYNLGIYTSKMKAGLDAVLDHHQLRDLFVSIKTPDLGPGKPDPFLLNQALQELELKPQQAVFVGDSTYDMMAGRAANANTLGVAWGYHTPDQLNQAGAQKIVTKMQDIVPAITSWA